VSASPQVLISPTGRREEEEEETEEGMYVCMSKGCSIMAQNLMETF